MCEAAPPLPGLAEGKGIRNLLIWVTEASFWSSKSRSPPWLGSTHQLLLSRKVSSRQRALGCASSFLEQPEVGLNRSRISWKRAQGLCPARFWGDQATGTGEVMAIPECDRRIRDGRGKGEGQAGAEAEHIPVGCCREEHTALGKWGKAGGLRPPLLQ